MRKASTSKGVKTPSKPLKDVVCYVETFNEDGTDARENTIKVLENLGAKVDSVFKIGLTHMVWSNGNMKHVKAAEYMDITVVSPLWVENCRESGKRVPEGDFAVNPATGGVHSTGRLVEPLFQPAKSLPDPDSPSFSSSQIVANSATTSHPLRGLDRNTISTSSVKLTAKSKLVSKPVSKRPVPVQDEENLVPSRPSTSTASSRGSKQRQQEHRISSPEVNRSVPLSSRHSPRLQLSTSPARKRPSSGKNSSTASKDSTTGSTRSSRKIVNRDPEHVDRSDNEVTSDDDVPRPPVARPIARVKSQRGKMQATAAASDNEDRAGDDDADSRAGIAKNVITTSIATAHTPTTADTTTDVVARAHSSSRELCRDVRCVCLSGFAGEERAILGDILRTLTNTASVASLSSASSANSSSSGHGRLKVTIAGDDDTSIKTLMKMSHVVAATENPRRTIRVLFALARGVPVISEAWVFASLEQGQWVADCIPYLHDRFGRATSQSAVAPVVRCMKTSATASSGGTDIGGSGAGTNMFKVYVGPCVDPPRAVVRGLVGAWSRTTETMSMIDADFIIMDSAGNGLEVLRREIAGLPSSVVMGQMTKCLQELQGTGHVLTCKEFFDCVENNELIPTVAHPPISSRNKATTAPAACNLASSDEKPADDGVGVVRKRPSTGKNKTPAITNKKKKSSGPTPASRSAGVRSSSSTAAKVTATHEGNTTATCDDNNDDDDGVDDGLVLALDAGESPSFEESLGAHQKRRQRKSDGRGRGDGTSVGDSNSGSSTSTEYVLRKRASCSYKSNSARNSADNSVFHYVNSDDDDEGEWVGDEEAAKDVRKAKTRPSTNTIITTPINGAQKSLPGKRMVRGSGSGSGGSRVSFRDDFDASSSQNDQDKDGWIHASRSSSGSVNGKKKRPLEDVIPPQDSISPSGARKSRRSAGGPAARDGATVTNPNSSIISIGRRTDVGRGGSYGEGRLQQRFCREVDRESDSEEEWTELGEKTNTATDDGDGTADGTYEGSSGDVPSPSW